MASTVQQKISLASSLNAEGLSPYILTALHDNGIDPSGIVSQGYDGAYLTVYHFASHIVMRSLTSQHVEAKFNFG